MAGRRGRGNRGNYKFTYKRKAALARAQKISARKRRGDSPLKKAGKIAGIVAVGATAAYLGHRHRGTIGKTASNWRAAVQPGNKEQVRINNAVSNGHPSRTTISDTDRLRAQNTRDRLNRQSLPPHMGGPDRRWYDDDNNIATEAMTNRGVRQTIKKHQKVAAEGQSTSSYTGTPGGTKTPPAAKISKARADHNGGYSDDQWQAILGFEESPRQPTTSHSTGKVSAARGPSVAQTTTQSRSAKSTPATPKVSKNLNAFTPTPMSRLRGMQAEDEKLLGQSTESLTPVFREPKK